MKTNYFTILKPSKGLYKQRGSKFISFAYPVCNEDEINENIRNIRKEHHTARHHCFAWKLEGEEGRFRTYDAGEPSGTAGRPILGQILAKDISDVLVVVVRYFGGILLGTGGLINAYKTAAAEALQSAEIIEKYYYDDFSVSFNYADMNSLMKIINELKGEVSDQQYTSKCTMKVKIRRGFTTRFMEAFISNKEIEVLKIH